jgi:hypothetical protein
MDATSFKDVVESARERGEIIRVYREGLEDGWAEGFVVGVGPDFFALCLIDKGCRVDGFNCLRYCDITDFVVPAPRAQFLKRALMFRGQTQVSGLTFELISLPMLLQSAGKAFPVVSIFYEADDEICYIGRVHRVTINEVHLLEISPDAQWDSMPTVHPLAGITRVDFGGAYEEALYLVASAN